MDARNTYCYRFPTMRNDVTMSRPVARLSLLGELARPRPVRPLLGTEVGHGRVVLMADTGSTPSHNHDTQSITLTLGREAGDRGVMCVSIRLGAALYCSAQREVPKSTNRIHVSTFGLEVLNTLYRFEQHEVSIHSRPEPFQHGYRRRVNPIMQRRE